MYLGKAGDNQKIEKFGIEIPIVKKTEKDEKFYIDLLDFDGTENRIRSDKRFRITDDVDKITEAKDYFMIIIKPVDEVSIHKIIQHRLFRFKDFSNSRLGKRNIQVYFKGEENNHDTYLIINNSRLNIGKMYNTWNFIVGDDKEAYMYGIRLKFENGLFKAEFNTYEKL